MAPSDFTEFPALVAAARWAVDAAQAADSVAIDDAEFDVVLAAARYDRITGFVASAVEAGAVEISSTQRERLDASWHEELTTCVALEALIVRIDTVLADAGIRRLLSKGAAVAHLDYPDPSMRTFGDIDLVLHPDDWHAGIEALTAAGFDRSSPPLPLDFDHRYGKGATLHDAEGHELDLHRRFAIGRFGVTARMEDAFHDPTTIVLGGRDVPAPSTEIRLLHACYHASLGGFRRLRAFTDVARIATRSDTDLAAAYQIATAWRADAVVTAAISEAWRRLGLDPDHSVAVEARRRHISPADSRALDVFAEHRPFSRQALTGASRLRAGAPRYLLALGLSRLRSRDA